MKRHAMYPAGLALLVAVVVLGANTAFAQFGLNAPQPQAPPHHALLSTLQGRFVFGQISDSGKDQYMLDTLTGRLWRIGESSRIGTHLKPVPYCASESDCQDAPGEPEPPAPKP